MGNFIWNLLRNLLVLFIGNVRNILAGYHAYFKSWMTPVPTNNERAVSVDIKLFSFLIFHGWLNVVPRSHWWRAQMLKFLRQKFSNSILISNLEVKYIIVEILYRWHLVALIQHGIEIFQKREWSEYMNWIFFLK
jgi:hypothetical protein